MGQCSAKLFLHCIRLQGCNPRQDRKSSNPGPQSQTSFQPTAGEAGLPVLSTPSKILFCDLCLGPGESRTYSYTETIPHTASPTYRGTAVKYSYKLTIGTQKLNCQTSMLRVP